MNFNEIIGKELINPTIDLAIDYTEIGIDELISSELFREIPIIKTIVAITKTSFAIKEISFAKKFLVFLKEFHSKQIDETNLAEFKLRFNTEKNYREKVIETLVVTIDKIYGNLKPRILANLFNYHLDGELSWDEFLSLNQSLDALHTFGIKNFRKAFSLLLPKTIVKDEYLQNVYPYIIAAGLGIIYENEFEINDLGNKLYVYGIKPLEKY